MFEQGVPFNRTFARNSFMLLLWQNSEAIHFLPILNSRKLIEPESPNCPISVKNMSAFLHFLFQYLHTKIIVGQVCLSDYMHTLNGLIKSG